MNIEKRHQLYNKLKDTDIKYKPFKGNNDIIQTYSVGEYEGVKICLTVNHFNRVASYQCYNELLGYYESTSLSGIKRMIHNRKVFY